jgi:predicted transcriptional regulator
VPHLLLSIYPRWAEAILVGTKTVEVRRRAPRLQPGTRLVLYATLPVGRVVGSVVATEVLVGPPDDLWRSEGPGTGLAREELAAYVGTRATAAFIRLAAPESCEPFDLPFRAPQVSQWLRPHIPSHACVLSALPPSRAGGKMWIP